MKRFVFALTFITGVFAWAGGDETNNGAGGGEFNIVYARQTLPRLLDACLASPPCRSGVTNELRTLLRQKTWEKTEIKFRTSRELGDKVSQRSGSVIEINKDALHKNSPDGVRPWNFADAVEFLLQTYGAHEGFDTAIAQKLGAQVSNLAIVGSRTSIMSDPGYEQFSFSLFREPLSTLIIEDLKGISDSFEVPFASHLDCSIASNGEGALRDVRVESAYWGLVNAHSSRPHSILSVTGRLAFRCADHRGMLASFTSNYRVLITVRPLRAKEDHRWVMDPSTLVIEQTGIEEQKP